MIGNKYVNVLMGNAASTNLEEGGHRLSYVYEEIIERGFELPANDNRAPASQRAKSPAFWIIIALLAMFAALILY